MSMRLPTLLLAVLLAGCGNAHPSAVGDDPTPSAHGVTFSPSPVPASVTDTEACPKQDPVHLPGDQATVTDAFLCGSEDRAVPGDGRWLFTTVRRITGGLDALLAAYGPADVPAGGHVSCTADLVSPLPVWLHSSDGVVAARAPFGVCGKPTPEGAKAYTGLTSTLVWDRKDRQIQTELSIGSRCSDAYKDVLSLDEQYSPARANSRPLPAPLSGRVSVCTYTIVKDAQGDRVGHLVSHHDLTAAQIGDLNAGLSRVTVDRSCSRHEQTGFALVGGSLVVALGGCAVSQDSSWWRAGDDVRSAVS